MLGFMEKLVSASNLNNYYSDSVVSSWIVEGEEIVCSFVGSPNVNSYIQELGNEMIDLLIGSKKLAGMLCDLQSLPFSIDGVNLVYDKDKEVTELRVKITPGVERNFKLLFAMSFMKFIEDVMIDRFEQNPKTTKDQMEAIRAFVQSITVGRVGEPINDLYSICLDGIKSANPAMSKALKHLYVSGLETELANRGVKSSEFFELNDNVLSIKDITDVRIVNAIAERTAWRVARNFAKKGDKNSKVTNITDVLRREILQLTGVDGKDGILIDGYDCDAFIGENGTDLVNDFPLILKIAGSDGKLRDITREEAFRINAASEMFGGLLIDIRGHAKGERYTKSKEPVYGILHERFADLIPYLMQGPIACNSIVYKETNETITYFDYAVNLGNLFKSRVYSDLKDDLYRILLPKFYKDGYLDKKSLLEADSYISSCILDSGFGLDGYDMPELVEFVDKKIKELPSANRAIPQATNNTLQVPSDPMSDSTHSNDSGRGTDSQSGSPKRQPKVINSIAKNKGTGSQSGKIQLTISSTGYADNNMSTIRTEPLLSQGEPSQTRFVPRSVTLNIMATRSVPYPQQSLQNGQKTIQKKPAESSLPPSSLGSTLEVGNPSSPTGKTELFFNQRVDKTCSAKPPASSSQQKSHDLLTTAGTSASAIHKHSEVLSTLDETSVESSQSSIGSPKVTQKKNSGCIVM